MTYLDRVYINQLATYICKPAKNPKSIIIIRTPYKAENYIPWMEKIAYYTNALVFVQDVRGRYESKGDWLPYSSEKRDAYFLLNYIDDVINKNLPIIGIGSSYEAYCARVLAGLSSDVRGIILRVGVRSEREAIFEKGKLRLSDRLWWLLTHGMGKTSNFQAFLEIKKKYPDLWQWDIREYVSTFGLKNFMGTNLSDRIIYPDCALYAIGGWRDGYVTVTLEDYLLWKNCVKILIIGDWNHNLHHPGVKK